jgi:hypothetical protein
MAPPVPFISEVFILLYGGTCRVCWRCRVGSRWVIGTQSTLIALSYQWLIFVSLSLSDGYSCSSGGAFEGLSFVSVVYPYFLVVYLFVCFSFLPYIVGSAGVYFLYLLCTLFCKVFEDCSCCGCGKCEVRSSTLLSKVEVEQFISGRTHKPNALRFWVIVWRPTHM